MRVIILAAGQGTRLRPFTDDRPKCLVELNGRPLLHRQLEVLRAAGLTEIALVGGYRADCLEGQGVEVLHNPHFATTNMVSTLFCAQDWMVDGEDLLIAYGDIVYELSVLESLLATDAPLAISVDREWRRYWEIRMENPLSDAETLKLNSHNCITELGKKPTSYSDVQGQYMGLIKVKGNCVKAFRNAWHNLDRTVLRDGKDFDNMYMTTFLQHLIDTGWTARAAFTENGWLEVDTVEDLNQYHGLHLSGRLSTFIQLRD
ncbi:MULTISPECIES: NTP transferase domain-containing protein [Pseudomonas]|uniref:Phosphocholine cytidylyltransferase family protein n=1 Tax=Pseudomonas pergaminensis TaxID=2853159 RepID=A0ABD7TLW5_9PSED|nr:MULTISPECIES: phosphocholine cytidylyltransferase family protein [Pseudomonas]AQT93338.1 nucleotidyl transferase [Pseudomonas azotoformans]UMY51101.1 phosphocholine cytidylyltransferase family protein [Pseudomonas azotoformans]USW02757.1 phosphocholine cytidylyltransferase family protein [Pseudomonas pergaminensis]